MQALREYTEMLVYHREKFFSTSLLRQSVVCACVKLLRSEGCYLPHKAVSVWGSEGGCRPLYIQSRSMQIRNPAHHPVELIQRFSAFQTLSVDPNFQSNFPCNPKLLL